MSYNLPLSSTTDYGVIKVGTGLSVANGVVSTTNGTRDVGYFYANNTQTNLLPINTVALTNTTLSQGVTLVGGSQVTVSKTGNYTLDFMAQFSKSSASGAAAVGFFWLRKNGIDVPDSTSDLTTNSVSSGVVASWTYTLPLLANDYLEMVWSCPLANAILVAIPAQAGPPIIPAAPSVRMTLLQV